MFFIQEGIVDIITIEGTVVTSLADGSYFGGSFHYLLFLIIRIELTNSEKNFKKFQKF